MLSINFSDYDFRVRIVQDEKQIFDPCRKKFVKITPEEWVRQNWIQYLHCELEFPISLMAVEQGIVVNQLKKRCDIVAYTQRGKPLLIVECKAPSVKLKQAALDQAARYNLKLKVPFLLISNGEETVIYQIDHKTDQYQLLHSIPSYQQMIDLWENA